MCAALKNATARLKPHRKLRRRQNDSSYSRQTFYRLAVTSPPHGRENAVLPMRKPLTLFFPRDPCVCVEELKVCGLDCREEEY